MCSNALKVTTLNALWTNKFLYCVANPPSNLVQESSTTPRDHHQIPPMALIAKFNRKTMFNSTNEGHI